jgi:hypothetical protein
VSTRNLPERCPNIDCTNKLGEGTFVIVTLDSLAIGTSERPTKPLQLIMCRPCGDLLNSRIENSHG